MVFAFVDVWQSFVGKRNAVAAIADHSCPAAYQLFMATWMLALKKNTGKQRPPPLKRSDLWRPICSFSRERGLQKGCANYSSVSILSGGCLSLRRLFEPPG